MMTKRKRPKFQAGDIVEEFYYGQPDGIPDISYWLIVKIRFYCYTSSSNKQQEFYMYHFKSLSSNYTWYATRDYVDLSYNFRKVA